MDEDLSNLVKKLRDETTFVQSEKKHLVDLYSQLVKKSEKLFTKQWLISRQHLILDDLIFGRNRSTQNQCCNKFSLITNKHQFIESYKVLGHNDYYVSEFLKALREKPQYLAQLIVKSEKLSSIPFINGVDNHFFSPQQLIPIVFQSLYGNCVLIQDEYFCLQLLKHLMELQFTTFDSSTNIFLNNIANNELATNSNIDLRRLIRKQSCSFNILFKLYTSFSYSAQLFLITALYEPINQILTDEWFLDIDPDKALERFGHDEIKNKFGQPNTKEYKLKTQKYREKIVNLLYTTTLSFIDSINSSLYSFPPSLTWLVNQLYKLVSKNNSKSNQPEIARKLCCDLIMALYICPAICDPEPYGIISDVQVSNIARHNLMQIANILQVLAMSDDDKDPKAQDLYCKFRNNCVSDILNSIISIPKSTRSTGSASNEQQLFSQSQIDLYSINGPNFSTEIPLNLSTTSSVTNSSSINQNLIFRTSIMISLQDIYRLIIYLRQIYKEQSLVESEESRWLKSIIPSDFLNQALESVALSLNSQKKSANNLSNISYTIDSNEVIASLLKEANLDDGCQILILSISDKGFDCPGMLTEEKVLNEYDSSVASRISKHHRNKKSSKYSRKDHQNYKTNSVEDNDDNLDNSFEPSIKLQSETGIDRDEIRSRHDGSVEGISEVCETNDCRSISSNDEDDDEDNGNRNQLNDLDDDVNQLEPDGLSDFDNFSGRDTPIISGRDTPSSHSHEDLQNISSSRNGNNINTSNQNISNANANIVNNANQINNNMNPSRGPQLPITVQKANREDINDKFCKFEINKINPVKEEQLSETGWSLDADPPESVNNEPINDRLGIDENSSTINTLSTNSVISRYTSTSNNLRTLNSSSSVTSSVVTNNTNNNNSSNNLVGLNPQSTLINFGNDQDYSLLNNLPNNLNAIGSNNINNQNVINTNNNISNSININTTSTNSNNNNNNTTNNQNNISSITGTDNDQNVDDRYSVVSDSAAWSTDIINNSDSDFESNSPSKYTPYSTYSSNCSSTHPPLNQSLINELASSNNSNQQQNNNNNNQINSSIGNNNSLPSNSSTSSLLVNFSNSNSNNNSNFQLSSSASSAMNIALNTDSNKRPDSGINSSNLTGSTSTGLSSLSMLNEQQQVLNPTPVASNSSNKTRLGSIFSNSNSVKFSFNLNSISNSTNNQSKKSGIHRIFNFNKPPSSSVKNSANDPFASLNPFSQNQISNSNNSPLQAAPTSAEIQSDNVDFILKKYKSNNPQTTSQPTPQTQNDAQLIDLSMPSSTSTQNENITTQNTTTTASSSVLLTKNFSSNSLQQQQQQPAQPIFYDSNNLEQSKLFLDAKKKLRLVLSWADCLGYNFFPSSHLKANKDNFLVMYLKVQLYDSISLQDKEKEAQLYETIRCVSNFNEQECYKLLRSLKKDYIRRVYYLTYLTKSKQNVLYSLNFIDKLLQRTEWHQKLRTHHFASVVTRLFLDTKENENQMYKFIHDFRQLVAVDEKFDLFKKFLQLLKKDYDVIWNGCQDELIQLGHLCLERLLLSKVYSYVMYPNGDIDHFRDKKVSECFDELANVITPSHPLIGISDIYSNECPWTAAQIELRRLNIYRTPQDKLACIRKCMLIIQNLLAIAKSPVCADDLHPVLIYVIIKANPPAFLSNVQYIEGFYGKQLELEDYYWAQFIFAFSYIKANMLNNKTSL